MSIKQISGSERSNFFHWERNDHGTKRLDTDVIPLHGFELSNHIDCNNLVGPIVLHVIFSLTPGVKFAGKNCFAVLSTTFLYFNLVA